MPDEFELKARIEAVTQARLRYHPSQPGAVTVLNLDDQLREAEKILAFFTTGEAPVS